MKEIILQMLERRQIKELKNLLISMNSVDMAEALENMEYKELIVIYRLLPEDVAADLFACMNSDMQEILINALTDDEIQDVVNEMYLDDTVDMLEDMPANVVDRILLVTSPDRRSQINTLLNYPEDSVGSIMTVEYIALRPDMTVADAIKKIRQVGMLKETIYTCYVSARRKLIGYVDVKDLLASSDGKLIAEIMETDIVSVGTNDDQEDVVKMFEKYAMMAVPVVDKLSCLVGIVTVDDAMIVQQEESTEDISRMAAIAPSEDTYFGTSVFQHGKNRITWLLVLMLSATITGFIIDHYEVAMATMTILASFIPMIMGTGGNSGSQSATLMIRGLAVDEIVPSDILKIIWKEVRVASIVGVVLGIANGVRIWFTYDDPILGLAIGLTLVATVMVAKLVGCMLPMLAKILKVDPALMAAPLISSLVDTISIVVYFGIVSMLFDF